MKILLLNVHKYKQVITLIKTVAAMLAVFLIGYVISGAYISSDSYISALQTENEKNIVIIDAGHGGEDPGAVSDNGIYEKDINLEIAFTVGDILRENGFAVIYTRCDDRLLYDASENVKGIKKITDLKNRCKIAAEYPNALFVSIHMNSYGDEKYSGLQVYYSENNGNSRILAEDIQESVKKNLQPQNNRKIKRGKGIYVLENTSNASVLIECGFLTNKEECKKLSEKEYQKQLSLSIVCGIINYKDTVASFR